MKENNNYTLKGKARIPTVRIAGILNYVQAQEAKYQGYSKEQSKFSTDTLKL
jgi:hypothetical protein